MGALRFVVTETSLGLFTGILVTAILEFAPANIVLLVLAIGLGSTIGMAVLLEISLRSVRPLKLKEALENIGALLVPGPLFKPTEVKIVAVGGKLIEDALGGVISSMMEAANNPAFFRQLLRNVTILMADFNEGRRGADGRITWSRVSLTFQQSHAAAQRAKAEKKEKAADADKLAWNAQLLKSREVLVEGILRLLGDDQAALREEVARHVRHYRTFIYSSYILITRRHPLLGSRKTVFFLYDPLTQPMNQRPHTELVILRVSDNQIVDELFEGEFRLLAEEDAVTIDKFGEILR